MRVDAAHACRCSRPPRRRRRRPTARRRRAGPSAASRRTSASPPRRRRCRWRPVSPARAAHCRPSTAAMSSPSGVEQPHQAEHGAMRARASAATAMTAPPMSNASGTASGPGGSPPPRVWKRAKRSVSSRRKISPACAVSMCALSTTRRAGAAAPARPTTLTDVGRRQQLGEAASVPSAPRGETTTRPESPASSRAVRPTTRPARQPRCARASDQPARGCAGSGVRLTSRDAEPAHPFAGALRRFALGVRAGETAGHTR